MKLENLEEYRDDEGYINIDDVLASEEFKILKETRGSQNRDKFWIALEDASIMIRTSNLDAENVEYTNYGDVTGQIVADAVLAVKQ